ncbi:calcium/sodium antiporter [Tannerella forsythia]|uniref:calcium/sodium antiporter n=1 Tax=Tannerella forsythia TaxID=28112 RepID=UPI00086AF53A|nr:Inner membrane protein YrbG [Tannerella forsythia]
MINNGVLAVGMVIAGLVLILIGANALTDGAAAVAKRFRISNLVIGLTIVAFGTSAPELAVSVVSALKGSPDLAMGNVVGSNIFNTLLIVGLTAAIVPLGVLKSTITKEVPLCILASVVLMVSANDLLIDGSTENTLSRSDGVILLGFFLIFFGYTFAIARSHAEGDETEAIKEMPIGKSALFIVAGLAGLIYGGQFFVDGSSQIARSLGVSESVIGLTLVAGGTSLPELATSVVAAWKKNPQMAIGNVVGSNLFNIFLVLGVSSSIYPLRVQGITFLDYAVMLGSCIMLFIFGRFFKKQMITRWEGIVMVLCFLVYMTYLVMNALATEGPTM